MNVVCKIEYNYIWLQKNKAKMIGYRSRLCIYTLMSIIGIVLLIPAQYLLRLKLKSGLDFLAYIGALIILSLSAGCISFSTYWGYHDILSPPHARLAFGRYRVIIPAQVPNRSPQQPPPQKIIHNIRTRKSAIRNNRAYKRALRRVVY